MSPDDRKRFGLEVLAHLLDNGLVATAKHYGAYFSPKFASVVDHARDDMKEFADKQTMSSPIDGGLDNLAGDLRGTPSTEVVPGGDDVMSGDLRGNPPTSTQSDGLITHEREDMNLDSVISEDHATMREKRKQVSVGRNDVLQNEVHTHT